MPGGFSLMRFPVGTKGTFCVTACSEANCAGLLIDCQTKQGSGLTLANLSRCVPPGHYDIDFSRIVPKRVSHLQVQLLPRIDAQLGVIEAIVDDNPKRTIRELLSSSVLEKSREQFSSAGERSQPNVHGHVPISPAEASRVPYRISAHKENVICFDCNRAHLRKRTNGLNRSRGRGRPQGDGHLR